ncbi:hypothetical protein HDU93_003021 [Gonapodya sp. JEL0774]|nr:hypothetical protein HDU93_003021 [Gonapodya sp. JEL0774]
MPPPPGGPPPAVFAGRIESVGKIVALKAGKGGSAITIGDVPECKPGDVVSINGVCITARSFNAADKALQCGMSRKTMENTTMGSLKVGSRVNIERWLQPETSARFAGHYVRVRVDRRTKFARRLSNKRTYSLESPTLPHIGDPFPTLTPGSYVTVDGVALHVYDRNPNRGEFRSLLIPKTLESTALGPAQLPSGETGPGDKKVGDRVNVELNVVEVTARIVSRTERAGGDRAVTTDDSQPQLDSILRTIPPYLRERFANGVAKRVAEILQQESLESVVGVSKRSAEGGLGAVRAGGTSTRKGVLKRGGQAPDQEDSQPARKWNGKLKL